MCHSFRSLEVNHRLTYWFIPAVQALHGQHDIVNIDAYQCSLKCYMHALANLVSTGIFCIEVTLHIFLHSFMQTANKSPSLRELVSLALTADKVSHWNDGKEDLMLR